MSLRTLQVCRTIDYLPPCSVATYSISRESEAAFPHYLRSVNLAPCHGPAWINLGQVALGQAKFGLAAEALERGFSLSKDKNPDLLYYAAMAGDFLEEALAKEAPPKEYEQLVSVYLAAHKPTEARNAINRALEAEPTARLWSLKGDLLYMEKDYKSAYDAFHQSARLDDQDGRPLLMMAYCAYELGNAPQAITALKKASAYKNQKKRAEELLGRLW